MFKKKPLVFLRCWGLLALIAIAAAIWDLAVGREDLIVLVTAGMISLILLYLFIIYLIDRKDFWKAFDDERLWEISARAQRNTCWSLFTMIWFLALGFSLPIMDFLKNDVSLILLVVMGIGIITHMATFVWYKYRL